MEKVQKVQEPVTLTPNITGRFLASDILPAILASNDVLHEQWGKPEHGWNMENPQKYVRDFRTIRLCMGMRSGHSYAAVKLAKPGDLIVELNDSHALDTCSQTVPGVTCISRHTLMTTEIYREHPTIWIIDFGYWPRTSMNAIREKLIRNINQRIVILGH